MNYLMVFIGGGLGSILRFAIGEMIKKNYSGMLPAATLSVNLLSSFILGLLTSWILQRTGSTGNIWLLVAVGFCGGFSTFSAFTLELFNFVRNDMFGIALLNIGVSVGGCLLALGIGYLIGKN
jgi:fluoride exporter